MLRILFVVIVTLALAVPASGDLVQGIDLGFIAPSHSSPTVNYLKVDVKAEGPGGLSKTKTGFTDVSGNMVLDIDYDFDPVTREVTGVNNLEFMDGQCVFDDDIHLNFYVFLVADIDVDTIDVKGTYETPGAGPISSFDSGSKEAAFATQYHNIVLNQGTIKIEGSTITGDVDETVYLPQDNITATTEGTGYLTTTLQSISNGIADYKVEMELPIDFNELAYDDGTIKARVAGTGTFKTVGYFSHTIPNHAPVAVNDPMTQHQSLYQCDEDASITISTFDTGVLANDTDVDGDDLDAYLETQAQHGHVDLNVEQGTFTYTPDPDYYGSDSFTYRAKDEEDEESNLATVELTVASVNDAPVAVDDFYSMKQGGLLNATASSGVLVNDTDADNDDFDTTHDDVLKMSLESGPTHGTFQWGTSGWFQYTPYADFHGTDSFVYTVFDGTDYSDSATVLIEVVAPIPGDATGDGQVDEADAAVLASNWGKSGMNWSNGDFNDDGSVNVADAAILAAHWGIGVEEADAAAVPEPGLAVMVLSSLFGLAFVRRRK